MTAPTAMVYRDGRLVKIPASEVVAGDVLLSKQVTECLVTAT